MPDAKLGRAVIEIIVDGDKMSAAFAKGQKDTQAFADRVSKSLTNVGTKLTTSVSLPLAAVAAASIKAASDTSESLNKMNVVFGQSAGAIEQWAQGSAKNLGMSKRAAYEATGTFGNLFTSMGMGQGQAAQMSQSIVELAADLASFNNLDPAEVLEKLRSGLVGETEPLRSLGVNINEATVKSEALRLGLVGVGGELTEAAKVQARYSLILQQTGNAQGDFARTADGLANSTRIAKAELEDAAAQLGESLVPAAKAGVDVVIELTAAFNQLGPEAQKNILLIGAALWGLGPAMTILGNLGRILGGIGALMGAGGGLAGMAAGAAVVAPIAAAAWGTYQIRDNLQSVIDLNFGGEVEKWRAELAGIDELLSDPGWVAAMAAGSEENQRQLDELRARAEGLRNLLGELGSAAPGPDMAERLRQPAAVLADMAEKLRGAKSEAAGLAAALGGVGTNLSAMQRYMDTFGHFAQTGLNLPYSPRTTGAGANMTLATGGGAIGQMGGGFAQYPWMANQAEWWNNLLSGATGWTIKTWDEWQAEAEQAGKAGEKAVGQFADTVESRFDALANNITKQLDDASEHIKGLVPGLPGLPGAGGGIEPGQNSWAERFFREADIAAAYGGRGMGKDTQKWLEMYYPGQSLAHAGPEATRITQQAGAGNWFAPGVFERVDWQAMAQQALQQQQGNKISTYAGQAAAALTAAGKPLTAENMKQMVDQLAAAQEENLVPSLQDIRTAVQTQDTNTQTSLGNVVKALDGIAGLLAPPPTTTPPGPNGPTQPPGPAIPAYAGGTPFHPGGWALVGDVPEIVDLPRGARVTPLPAMTGGGNGLEALADATMARLGANDEQMSRLARGLADRLADVAGERAMAIMLQEFGG